MTEEEYQKVKKQLEDGAKTVSIVHATGTGKSFNALQLAYDNQDKQIIYVTPYNSIIEHIQKIMADVVSEHPEVNFDNVDGVTNQIAQILFNLERSAFNKAYNIKSIMDAIKEYISIKASGSKIIHNQPK